MKELKSTNQMSSELCSDKMSQSQEQGNKTNYSSGMANGLAMHNQLLPISWGEAGAMDVSNLLQTINWLYCNNKKTNQKVGNMEGSVLLTLMFWFGLTLKQAVHARMESNSSCCSDQFAYIPMHGQWHVPAVHVTYKTKLSMVAVDAARPLTNHLYLSVPEVAREVLDQWWESCGRPLGGATILTSAVDDLKCWLRKFIRNYNREHYSRLKKGRISKYLFRRICHSKIGDIVDASIIVGKTHYLAKTMLSYTARNTRHLNSIYSNVCDAITLEYIVDAFGSDNPNFKPNLPEFFDSKDSDQYIGSRYCPKDITVRNFVAWLKIEISIKRKEDLTKVYTLWEFHNAFTLYTAQMLLYASGYRDVCNPFSKVFEIDWGSGFLFIHDKERLHSYKPRIVWLPDICIQQIRAYQEHINALMGSLLFADMRIFNAKKSQAESMAIGNFIMRKRGKHGKLQIIDRIESGEWLPFLFFMAEKGWCEVRQKNVAPIIEEAMPLPMNANRHYIRSKLRETNCPAETVQQFLGHWEIGQEPFSRYSGLDPWSYRQQLKKYWEPVFNGPGWEVIGGIK